MLTFPPEPIVDVGPTCMATSPDAVDVRPAVVMLTMPLLDALSEIDPPLEDESTLAPAAIRISP
ncbi:hypothetical protein PI125_g26134 [Phytophthora idaei]|nr:hypothetical protein PI125_g26134 [Phytophthora idaei]